MDYRPLGRSGFKVSSVCLGAMTFTRETDEDESARIIHAALDRGVNFIDTAEMYEDGGSEAAIGKALKGKPRDKVFLATKVDPNASVSCRKGGLTRHHVKIACEGSLERLQTDYIDLYLLHHFSPAVPLEETMYALEQLVREGKVLYVGVSMFPSYEMMRMIDLAEKNGYAPIVNAQWKYSLIERGVEDEIAPFCRKFGVGMTAFSPLAGGVLTGKYKNREVKDNTRAAAYSRFANMLDDRTEAIVSELEKISGDHGLKPHHVALAWAQKNPALSAAIVGARSVEQFEDTAKGFDFELSDDELKRLNEVSDRPGWSK